MKKYHGDAFCDQDYLLYTIKTAAGVAGAPVIKRDSEDCYWIRAIHQRDVSMIIPNIRAGIKLNKSMFQRIYRSSALLLRHNYDLGNALVTLDYQEMQPSDLKKVIAEVDKE